MAGARLRTRNAVSALELAGLLLASAGAGLLYHAIWAEGRAVTAAIYGACTGSVVIAFERGLYLAGFQDWLRRRPSYLYVPLAEAVYIALILLGNTLGGTIVYAADLIGGTLLDAIVPSGRVLLYAMLVSAVFVFVLRVRDLLGRRIFTSLLIGRYHAPVQEERIFLFVDVAGSTHFAEQQGDVAAQRYLGAIFATMAPPVRASHGSIDDYVGDMAMITWPMRAGLAGANCVACVFAIRDALARDADRWLAEFGTVPRVRAALHAGPIVTAEIGVDRHKIAYFGDTVNTTARLEGCCRTLNSEVVISGPLLARLGSLPPGILAGSLGTHRLKGRDEPMEIFSLNEAPDPLREPASSL